MLRINPHRQLKSKPFLRGSRRYFRDETPRRCTIFLRASSGDPPIAATPNPSARPEFAVNATECRHILVHDASATHLYPTPATDRTHGPRATSNCLWAPGAAESESRDNQGIAGRRNCAASRIAAASEHQPTQRAWESAPSVGDRKETAAAKNTRRENPLCANASRQGLLTGHLNSIDRAFWLFSAFLFARNSLSADQITINLKREGPALLSLWNYYSRPLRTCPVSRDFWRRNILIFGDNIGCGGFGWISRLFMRFPNKSFMKIQECRLNAINLRWRKRAAFLCIISLKCQIRGFGMSSQPQA